MSIRSGSKVVRSWRPARWRFGREGTPRRARTVDPPQPCRGAATWSASLLGSRGSPNPCELRMVKPFLLTLPAGLATAPAKH
jgi:hypothetical protein